MGKPAIEMSSKSRYMVRLDTSNFSDKYFIVVFSLFARMFIKCNNLYNLIISFPSMDLLRPYD